MITVSRDDSLKRERLISIQRVIRSNNRDVLSTLRNNNRAADSNANGA